MTLNCEVLFGMPQQEIASRMRTVLGGAKRIRIVSGFMTVEGIRSLLPALRGNISAVGSIVVGAGTYRAYEAFDELMRAGVPVANLFVHLGHTDATGASARRKFIYYHPMLHSKVVYAEDGSGQATAFIGSHNITGFALTGQNGEAGVVITGAASDPQFHRVRDHIDESQRQSVIYSPGMKEAFSWWLSRYLEGLGTKASDHPTDEESKKTIILLVGAQRALVPASGQTIYFELPSILEGLVRSLGTEVHVYVFDQLPATPWEALARKRHAQANYWCKTVGIEQQGAAKELTTDWFLDDITRPKLLKARRPFRPNVGRDMHQVRVETVKEIYGDFEYLFEKKVKSWKPVFGEGEERPLPILDREYRSLLRELDMANFEDRSWKLVRGLVPEERDEQSEGELAMKRLTPEAGSFVLVSTRRRKKGAR